MTEQNFLVVGIGASAGGIEVLTQFFQRIPGNTNAAYVVITHFPGDKVSNLDTILSKVTSMPVHKVKDNISIQPGNIYVQAEGVYLNCANRRLQGMPRNSENKINKAVDNFFTSMAEDVGSFAVGIILSGTGTDGVEGVKAIERNGGFVMVQEPTTAAFDGMPMSIIHFDHPDIIATPENLADFITKYDMQLRSNLSGAA